MTKIKQVDGYIYDGTQMIKSKLTVRYTSDEMGKTLSISDDKNAMYVVGFEDIEEMIKE